MNGNNEIIISSDCTRQVWSGSSNPARGPAILSRSFDHRWRRLKWSLTVASDEFWNAGWVDNFVLKPRIVFEIDSKWETLGKRVS